MKQESGRQQEGEQGEHGPAPYVTDTLLQSLQGTLEHPPLTLSLLMGPSHGLAHAGKP